MYNIQGLYLTAQQKNDLVEHLVRLKPGLVVVIDDPPLAVRIKEHLPGTTVVYRKYNIHPEGDDNSHLKFRPDEWLNAYLADMPVFHNVHWYCNNEPGASQGCFNWLFECAKLTLLNGGKGVFGNFSVGTPNQEDWLKGENLLRLIGNNPNQLAVGLHEYAPTFVNYEFGFGYDPLSWPIQIKDTGNFLGRYRLMLQLCDNLGIKRPQIAITEWGFDRIDAVYTWQQSLPKVGFCDDVGAPACNMAAWSAYMPEYYDFGDAGWQEYMVSQLIWIWDALYSYDPEIIGVALFCWGSIGRWIYYDYKDILNIIPMMEFYTWEKNPMTISPVTKTVWKYTMNVRSEPGLYTPVVGRVLKDTVSKKIKIKDEYVWVKIGAKQWVAVYDLRRNELYVKEVS